MDWPEEYSKISQTVREAAYKQYKVEAITKTTLLPGQEKIGYHQRTLTTDYYLFCSPEGIIQHNLDILHADFMQQVDGLI